MLSLPDMHTHSEFSHDSVCKIEDMLLSQLEKGTPIFAVTDHLDVYNYMNYDVFTPIHNSNAEARRLTEKYDGRCIVLSGYEVSEAFYFPEIYKKHKFDCDVIIGSVHCVRHPDHGEPYSCIDFSTFSEEELYEYLDIYFDDVITLLDTLDFDILAHLTCPLRYIVGKYGRKISLSRFESKIENILKRVISEGKSLEINTSSFALLGDFMPFSDIVRKYYLLGGRMITLGSDAHVVENASCSFDAALELIKSTGFESVYYYQNRKPCAVGVNQ